MEQDADGDGKLSADELGERGGMMLQRGDANRDGYLDRKELEQMVANRGQLGRGPGQAPGGPAAIAPDRPEEPGHAMGFHEGMEQSGRAMRRLRRSEFDEKSRAGDLAAIEQIQTGLLAAKQQLEQVEMSEAAKEKFGSDVMGYHLAMRRSLAEALKISLDLELAVASGHADKAKEALDELVTHQKESHDLFQPEEEEENERPGLRVLPKRPGEGG